MDLEVLNEQTGEEIVGDQTQIPRNSSVIIKRIPLAQGKEIIAKSCVTVPNANNGTSTADNRTRDKRPDLMEQSRGTNAAPGAVQWCKRCRGEGHLSDVCPTLGDNSLEKPVLKYATGIPINMLDFVTDPTLPNVMLHPSGALVVLKKLNSHLHQRKGAADAPPVEADEDTIPKEFKCPICEQLLSNAVLLACCGKSYCDACVRNKLLNDEHWRCLCGKEEIRVDSIIPNESLRASVQSFRASQQQQSARNIALVPAVSVATSPAVAPIRPPEPQCHHCKQFGHLIETCPVRHAQQMQYVQQMQMQQQRAMMGYGFGMPPPAPMYPQPYPMSVPMGLPMPVPMQPFAHPPPRGIMTPQQFEAWKEQRKKAERQNGRSRSRSRSRSPRRRRRSRSSSPRSRRRRSRSRSPRRSKSPRRSRSRSPRLHRKHSRSPSTEAKRSKTGDDKDDKNGRELAKDSAASDPVAVESATIVDTTTITKAEGDDVHQDKTTDLPSVTPVENSAVSDESDSSGSESEDNKSVHDEKEVTNQKLESRESKSSKKSKTKKHKRSKKSSKRKDKGRDSDHEHRGSKSESSRYSSSRSKRDNDDRRDEHRASKPQSSAKEEQTKASVNVVASTPTVLPKDSSSHKDDAQPSEQVVASNPEVSKPSVFSRLSKGPVNATTTSEGRQSSDSSKISQATIDSRTNEKFIRSAITIHINDSDRDRHRKDDKPREDGKRKDEDKHSSRRDDDRHRHGESHRNDKPDSTSSSKDDSKHRSHRDDEKRDKKDGESKTIGSSHREGMHQSDKRSSQDSRKVVLSQK